MSDGEIIERLRERLAISSGRHLYGVLGPYPALARFANRLQEAPFTDSAHFPAPIQVNQAVLDAIPDQEFRNLASDEARYPEPTAKHVARAFDSFLRARLRESDLLVLSSLELLFAYNLELSPLRTLATDEKRILLLLPGKRRQERVIMFPDLSEEQRTLPTNLIAENHLWELSG